MKKTPNYSKSPRPPHAVQPVVVPKPKRTKPDANFAQSSDVREDRGIRQAKTAAKPVPRTRKKTP
jgi:hypothetical protein